MKLSTTFSSALASLAIASPAADKREASPQSQGLLNVILNTLDVPHVPLEAVADLNQCMSNHPGFRTDYSKAADGVFSINNVDHTCCEMARGIWSQVSDGDRYGKAVFTQPCNGVTVTGLSKPRMGLLRSFFDSI